MIIRFFDPEVKGEDSQGRTLDTILSWDDDTLESSFDYIKTLFPLPEQSTARDVGPLVTPEVQQAFMNRPELRDSLIRAFNRMLTLLGLEYEKIQESDDPTDWNPDNTTDVTHAITQGPN
jgi:hypothetical protein